jgi:hypothetical protein
MGRINKAPAVRPACFAQNASVPHPFPRFCGNGWDTCTLFKGRMNKSEIRLTKTAVTGFDSAAAKLHFYTQIYTA